MQYYTLHAVGCSRKCALKRGIGAFVLSAEYRYDTDNLLAGIVVLSLLGLAVSWLSGRTERLLLSWR
jgi:sulfonate transport system permease protein